jgi:hypothetical protein
MNGPEERDQRSEIRDQVEEIRDQGEEARDAEFEAALSRAMRRVEVRAELSAKFLTLAAEAEQKRVEAGGGARLLKLSNLGRVLAFPQQRAWLGGVGVGLAAVLALGVFVGSRAYERHEQRVQAQRQFETAERITDQTLEHTREQLRQAGIVLGQ